MSEDTGRPPGRVTAFTAVLRELDDRDLRVVVRALLYSERMAHHEAMTEALRRWEGHPAPIKTPGPVTLTEYKAEKAEDDGKAAWLVTAMTPGEPYPRVIARVEPPYGENVAEAIAEAMNDRFAEEGGPRQAYQRRGTPRERARGMNRMPSPEGTPLGAMDPQGGKG